jgi:hypothetical protein
VDPLAAGISDGVRSGYRALESVLEGLRESLGVRAAGGRKPAEHGPGHGAREAPSGAVVDDVARLLAELLDRAGDVAHDVARAIGEGGGEDPAPAPPVEQVDLAAAIGGGAEGEFTIYNTGSARLPELRLLSTGLACGDDEIPNAEIHFEPETIENLGPREGVTVKVMIDPALDRIDATYQGVALTKPGDAVVLINFVCGDPGAAKAKMARKLSERRSTESEASAATAD